MIYVSSKTVGITRKTFDCQYAIESCHLEVFCKIGVLLNSDFSKTFEKYM